MNRKKMELRAWQVKDMPRQSIELMPSKENPGEITIVKQMSGDQPPPRETGAAANQNGKGIA